MSDQRGFISTHRFHPDLYKQSRTAERTLNAAIVHADITRSYEEYLEIFDEFYADDIEGRGPGELQWARASKEQRRSRIPLIFSNKSRGTFAADVQDWCPCEVRACAPSLRDINALSV